MWADSGRVVAVAAVVLGGAVGARTAAAVEAVVLENETVRLELAGDGRGARFVDPRTGADHAALPPGAAFAHVTAGGRVHGATALTRDGDLVRVAFGESGVRAALRFVAKPRYLTLEVASVEGEGIDVLTFIDLPLSPVGEATDSFAGCALALNLQTNVHEIPQPGARLRAMCYPRFGMAGARVALIGCPADRLRPILQEAVSEAPELPHSAVGGPWALDGPLNRGSYLFDFGDLTEATVDDWIRLAGELGINQIDFHGGRSFRFGDCRPNPELYPRGLDSLKAVVERLHAAGLAAGLHTYAFFIAKDAPWVTPVPDPRLAKDARYTLAAAIDAEAPTVPVEESTEARSEITGFFVRNSLTLQIDDELIVYRRVRKEPPYAFVECQRGAHGTRAAPHAAGAAVHHLKQCFFLFVPDPETTLLAEVAARTAEVYNACGFDMMYLDALDGEGILGGDEWGWHYGSRFVFELVRRLEKPPVMEMSTFHHHLWPVRARMGAWDHPTRSHKAFIDIHCRANDDVRRTFLPGHLGWWAVKTWSGIQGEPTFPDDIEYLCGKCLGRGEGFSIMGVNPANVDAVPAFRRLAPIMRQYEALRHAGTIPDAIRAELREPGKEFHLDQADDGSWQFRRVAYLKHKVALRDEASTRWSIENPFDAQPLALRIEALMAAAPYDGPDSVVIGGFGEEGDVGFPDRAAAPGVEIELGRATEAVRAGGPGGLLTVSNSGATPRRGAWARAARTFDPPLDLGGERALGLWVHGDGSGTVLNLQLRSPEHISGGIGDHYAVIDFTGWRYVELVEPEGERHGDYAWPYSSPYAIYRETVDYAHIGSLGICVNDVPGGAGSSLLLSSVKAPPLVAAKVTRPAVTVGGRTIVFPVEMEPGSYIEFRSMTDCKLYGAKGELLAEVAPEGEAPALAPGANHAAFGCAVAGEVQPRARVTAIAFGNRLREGD